MAKFHKPVKWNELLRETVQKSLDRYGIPNSVRRWRYRDVIAVDPSNVIAADPNKQRYSVVAEPYYFSMQLRCERCEEDFWFSAREQQLWYEQWGFWIDSIPKHCAGCRRKIRAEHGRE